MNENIRTVLEILKDEVAGDVEAALAKMAPDYSMTWMYRSKDGVLFPTTGHNIKKEMKGAYAIKGRNYDIKNITEGKDIVMIELVESYPDSETGVIYRTPLVLVLEMENGKIKKGRHYCDPSISHLHLSEEEINNAY